MTTLMEAVLPAAPPVPLPQTPIQHVTLSSGPVAYRQAGSGFPMILVHGWRGSSRYWETTLDLLDDARQMYALDLPGHGQTPPLRDAAGAARLAELVIEFADALGLEQFDLNGHSLGAAVAVYIAAHWPNRIRKLVLTSLGISRNLYEQLALNQAYIQMNLTMAFWRPWLLGWRPWQKLWQPWIEVIGHQPLVYWPLAANFIYQLPDDAALVREGVLEFLRTDTITALEGAISAGDPAFTNALSSVVAPTLLICASQDMIMPASGAQPLANALADCRLVELDHCGHLPMFEQPDEYHRHVREFLGV